MREKVNVYNGFRAFEKTATENRLHAPKLRALPTAPHPEKDYLVVLFTDFPIQPPIK
jgi:hypothetical protein